MAAARTQKRRDAMVRTYRGSTSDAYCVHPGRPLTDDQIASIIFNETRSLSGPGIDDARYNNAIVILHNNLNLRTLPKMAPPRGLSPLRSKRHMTTFCRQ